MLVLAVIIVLFIILTLWSSCVASARADRENTEIDSEVYRRNNDE